MATPDWHHRGRLVLFREEEEQPKPEPWIAESNARLRDRVSDEAAAARCLYAACIPNAPPLVTGYVRVSGT